MTRANGQGVGSNLPKAGIGISQTEYRPYFRGGGGNTAPNFTMNSSATFLGSGHWRVEFDTPHPDGTAYVISLQQTVDGQRDAVDPAPVEGTITASGFEFYTTTGDNGGTADALVQEGWYYSVDAPVDLVVAGAYFEESKVVDLNGSFYGKCNFASVDIHNNGALAQLTNPVVEGGWAQGADIFAYTGTPAAVKIFVNMLAIDAGASNYWARPKLLIEEITGSGWQATMDNLAMQATGNYDGDFVLADVAVHAFPPPNPRYQFSWYDKDNRTATLIPETYSQIVVEAVQREQTFGLV